MVRSHLIRFKKQKELNWIISTVTNINFLPTILIHNQEKWLWELNDHLREHSLVIYSQWMARSLSKGLGTQEMSYGTCESAGEKAIGLNQDKKKNREEGRVTNEPQSKTGVDQPHAHKGLWRHMNPILPPLQPNWTNLLTQVLIYAQKAIPEGETHTDAWNRALASNWSESRPVLRERALGIGNVWRSVRKDCTCRLGL